MKRGLLLALFALLLFSAQAKAQTSTQQSPTTLDSATYVAHNHTSATTTTITPPGGQYVYVIGLDISNCAGASAVTAAGPTYITTTGLTGNPQYQMGSGVAAGLCQPVPVPDIAKTLKSSTPGTAVTFVLPTFATNQTLSMNVYYYFAP